MDTKRTPANQHTADAYDAAQPVPRADYDQDKGPVVFTTTVLGVGPYCVEFADGEILATRTEQRARLIAAASELLALAQQYASECASCNGTGSRTITTYPGGIEVDNDDQPCEDCADIRQIIRKAEVQP